MKNAIMYYYGLEPIDIHQTGKQYRFMVGEDTYLLLPYDRDIKELKDIHTISEQLRVMGLPMHMLVSNREQQLFTTINQELYVLLQITAEKKDKICLGEILSFSKVIMDLTPYKSLYRNDWNTLWSTKIDYFAYQVSQFGKKFPVIRESFSYFCGLAENAIAYTNMMQKKTLCVAHKRIHKNMMQIELYNPLTLIVDYKVRDATEYFKDKFFYGYLSFEEVSYYLSYHLDKEEYDTFYTRMLFPSFYFDLYEDVIEKKAPEKELLRIIHKMTEYEQFLKDIHSYMSNTVTIIKPEWL
ncbi:MAG: hypothetical protein PHN72_03995 [Bacilli bacterium]|nr:hypothetical protein [Bacilli bacterium]